MIRALLRLVFVNVLGNLWRLLSAPLRLLRRRPGWVRVVVKEPLTARPVRRRWPFTAPGSLAGLSKLGQELGRDAHLQGVVIELGPVGAGWARLATLRQVVIGLRAAGKRVVVHTSAPGLRDYFVAVAADAVLVDESGPVGLFGLAAEVTFFAGALEKVGAEVEAEYRGAYKSFAETFTRRDMSTAHREATDAILDDLEAELVKAIADGRRVSPERARELLTGGPYMAEEAQRVGLVDGVCYLDEVDDWVARWSTGTGPAPALPAAAAVPAAPAASVKTAKVADLATWRAAQPRGLRWKPLFIAPRKIRVLSLSGTIVPGEGSSFPRQQLGAEAARRALEAVRRDRRVAAVVLHIDSRGGSAAASDLIWRAVVRLGRDKPVVAYFHDVAASGGYYLACAASKIVAHPTTLTGSIGVVAAKLNLETLRARAGLGTAILTRGEAAAMHSTSRGLSTEERRRLAAEVDALYKQFVGKVAEGRKLSPEAAEAVAQGRVWTGAAAHTRGLVDELGGIDEAIAAARTLGRRHPGEKLEVDDMQLAPRAGLAARLAGAAARTLGETTAFGLLRPLADAADLATLARERTLLWSPFEPPMG